MSESTTKSYPSTTAPDSSALSSAPSLASYPTHAELSKWISDFSAPLSNLDKNSATTELRRKVLQLSDIKSDLPVGGDGGDELADMQTVAMCRDIERACTSQLNPTETETGTGTGTN
ncbi:hypothetical protein JCM24511_03686 [Saitozyma sp. JCM 24511]|nr:hypothetical protein JCM24511_03686 [Saitozyma sp. JCM 24511]